MKTAPRKTARHILTGSIAAAYAAALLAGHSAQAANATWNGTADGFWATGTNWSAAPVPGTGNTATFNNAGNGNVVLDLGGGVTINTLFFDTALAAGYTIGSGGVDAQVLTLDNGGAITLDATVAADQLIDAALVLGNDGTAQTFTLTNASTTNSLTLAGSITGSTGAGLKTLAVAGAGATTLSGFISNGTDGTVAITKTGIGTLTLSNTGNTFSGGITIGASAGTVTATTNNGTNISGLGSGAVSVGAGSTLNLLSANTTGTTTTINNAITGTGLLKLTFTDTTATNTVLNNFNGFTGTIQLSNTGANADKLNLSGTQGTIGANVIVDSGSQLLQGGGQNTSFAGGLSIIGTGNSENRGAIRIIGVLGGDITLAGDSTIGTEGGFLTGNISATGANTLTLGTANSTNRVFLTGVLSNGTGTLSLLKTQANTAFLSGANTYTGATTISTGAIQLGIGQTGGTTGSISTSSALSVASGASLILNRSNATALGTDFGDITGAGNVAQNGTGTTTFAPAATMAYTGQTQVNRGTLVLDFANLATPTNLVSSSSVLNLGSGRLSVLGQAGAVATAQTFASTTLSAGSGFIAPNRGTGTSTTITLGAVTSGAGSTVTFQPGTAWAAGANATTAGVASTTEIVTVTSVSRPGGAVTIGGAGTFAYIGANAFYGTGTGTRYVVARGAAAAPYQIAGGPTSTAFVTTGGNASAVYLITGAQTLTGVTTNYALINNSAAAAAFANGGFAYTTNGFLNIGAGTITMSGTGAVTIGAERDFVVNNTAAGGLTISSVVANNGGGASNVTISSSGTGITTFSGANTYSGNTFLNGGTLSIAADANLGTAPGAATAGKLTFSGGTLRVVPAAAVTINANRGIQLNAGGGTITNTAAFQVTVNSIIAGVGGLTLSNTSTSTIAIGGANTYTGGTTISGTGIIAPTTNTAFGVGGTITLNGGQFRSTTGSAIVLANPVAIAANTTFPTVASEQTLTLTGPAVLTGSFTLNSGVGATVAGRSVTFSGGLGETTVSNLTKAGAGVLVLSGPSTYTGTTTVSAGRLTLVKNYALYNNTPASWTDTNITVASGATLNLRVGGVNEFTAANVDTIAALGTATGGFQDGSTLGLDTTAGNFTYSSVITNTNGGANALGLLKLGANTLTISGANTYTGATSIGGGVLVAANPAAFGPAGNNINMQSGAPQTNGSLELATDTSVNAYNLTTSSSFAHTITLNRATPGDGIIHNLGMLISGGNTQTFSPGANVTGGTAGITATGMNLSAGAANSTATLNPNGTTVSITGPVNIGVNNQPKILGLDGYTTGNSISGDITNGLNTLSLSKTNFSTWTLSGNNSYTGATTVTDGTLKAASTTALSSASAFAVNGGTLDLDGFNNTVGSLAGNGGAVALGSATLTTGGNNTSTTYFGDITGAGGLTKTGSGVFTVGNPISYTGATAVNAGGLVVDSTFASTAATVGDSATLGGVGTLAGAVTIQSGGILSPATTTTAGTITVGSLTLAAGSALAYEFGATSDLVAVTNASGLTLNGGALSLYAAGGVAPLATNGTYTLFTYNTAFGGSLANLSVANSQAGKTYQVNDAAGSITLTIGTAVSSDWSGTAGNGLWTTDGVGGNWNGSGAPNSLGAVANFGLIPASPTFLTVNGAKTVGSIIFDNTNSYTVTGGVADTITLNNGIASGAISTVTGNHTISAPIVLSGPANITPAAATTLTLGGVISGAKAVSFAGAGTTALAAANTYSEPTTIVAGATLQLGVGGTAGSIAPGSEITDNGTLAFNRSDTLTQGIHFATGISGSGTVNQAGTGKTILNSANTYTGVTTVSNGVLTILHASALGTTAAGTTVLAGAALEIEGGLTTVAEPLTLNGAGAASTGALRSTSGNNAWGTAVALGSAATIGSDADTLTIPSLTGAFGLTKAGAGTVNITGATAVTSTIVESGTLFMGTQAGASTTTTLGAASPVTLNGSSNLTIRRTDTGADDLIGAIDGTGSLTLLGDNAITLASGDFTMNNASTYSGGTGIAGARAGVTLGTSLGTGPITIGTNGQVFVNAASQTFTNEFTIGGQGWNETSGLLGALRLNATTISGTIALTSDTRITGTGTSTLFGEISGGFGLDFFEDTVIGTIALAGSNTYTGTTTVNSMGGGTTFPNLIVSNNNALGTTAAGTTVLGTGTTGNGSQLTLADGVVVTDETLTLDATAAGYRASLITAANGSATWDGNVVITGNATLIGFQANGASSNLTVGSSDTDTITGTNTLMMRGTGTGTINSAINLGTAGLFKTDAGTWTITSNNNDFTGLVNIAFGTLSVGSVADAGVNSAIGKGSQISLGQASASPLGVLQFTGASGGSTNRSIVINNSATQGTGAIENMVAGQTLTLSGNVTAATPAATTATVFTLGGAGDGVLSGDIAGSPFLSLSKTGTGTWELSGTNTYTGATTVTAGTLTFSAGSVFTPVAAVGLFTINGATAVANIAGTYNVPAGNGNAFFEIKGGGTLNFNGTSTLTATGGGGFRVGEASAGTMNVTGGSLTYNSVSSSNFVVGRTAGGNGTLDVSAGILTLTGAGGFILANDSTTSGTVTVGGTGTLDVSTATFRIGGNASATAATFNLNSGGTLVAGTSPTTTGGPSTFNFNGGTFKASASITTPALSRYNIRDGGAVIDTNGNAMTIAQALQHSDIGGDAATDGGLTKKGNGTLTLTGTNTYTGATNVNAGTLVFGVSETLSALNIADGAVVILGSIAPAPGPGEGEEAPFFAAGDSIGAEFSAAGGAPAVAAVPEPGSVALLFGGALALLGVRRRRQA